ncbi:hypothetical protein MKW92_019781 [Papaver armeniacum]|nr:hypothetical protein MKW92_019781 [Papaver armeniacum]
MKRSMFIALGWYSWNLLLDEKRTKEMKIEALLNGWAHRFLETPLDALLDEEVKEGSNVAEMTSVFRLGLMCTSTLPSNRPTMSEALQFLVRHCSSQEIYEKKALVTADNDVAPLLLSRHSADLLSTYKGGRSKKRISDLNHSAPEV